MILAFNIDFSLRQKDKTYKKGKSLGGQIFFPQIDKKNRQKDEPNNEKREANRDRFGLFSKFQNEMPFYISLN